MARPKTGDKTTQQARKWAAAYWKRIESDLLFQYQELLRITPVPDGAVQFEGLPLPPGVLQAVLEKTRTDADSFDSISSLAAALLREGEQIPPALGEFIADVQQGNRKRRGKRKARGKANRDVKLYLVVAHVHKNFEIAIDSNMGKGVSAVEVVSQVTGCSYDVVSKAYQHFRKRALPPLVAP